MARYEWRTTKIGRRYVRLEDEAPGAVVVHAPAPPVAAVVEPQVPEVVTAPAEVVSAPPTASVAAAVTTKTPAKPRTRRKRTVKKSDG